MTSATLALQFRKLLNKYAKETTGSTEGIQWQGHDFSMRGMSSLESACTSGAGHLLSFTGTDTIPAISFLEDYYGADIEKELVGASVPATEHSVMCMGTKDDEIGTFRRLLKLYPTGILSVVSDTWDLWKVLYAILPTLKDEIMARDGKLVIRPDSGDPVDIICGCLEENMSSDDWDSTTKQERKGVIELLWDVFGGTVNDQGYKVLDPHIGAIYGDSINAERAITISERLKAKGFASTNIVYGVGSYTYQMNTRDTFGFATKATYGEVVEEFMEYHKNDDGTFTMIDGDNEHIVPEDKVDNNMGWLARATLGREIFKDPITDDGTKKSAKGLLRVDEVDGVYRLKDQCSIKEEQGGALETVFLNGVLTKKQSLAEIRERVAKNF